MKRTARPRAVSVRRLRRRTFLRVSGKRLIGALAEVTADGYVFRVDMRLRPNGDSGPLVCSLGMLEEYFYVQGREWERYAWIKGRLVSEGASEAAQRLQKQLDAIVTPFIYRRYLDFGVISAIRALHLQIRQEAQRRASMRPDKADDIKLGRGGIREIEFSAQVFQLIRGGQDAGFRVRPTLAVLRHAATHGLIDTSVCVKLSQAYRFLRELEHRLQYRNDAQTHAMPVDPEERVALARAMGCDDYAALMFKLDVHREFVEQQFDQIFADKVSGRDGCGAPEDGAAAWVWSSALADDSADDALRARLIELGVPEPDELLARLRAVWQSSRYAGLAERSRQRFDIVAQRALEAATDVGAARTARRYGGAFLRPARSREPARRVPRAADRISAGAASGAVGAGRFALGGRLSDSPSAIARRTPRRRGDGRVRSTGLNSSARCACVWPRRMASSNRWTCCATRTRPRCSASC